MQIKTLKATFKRNFIIQIRAYTKDFFIGHLLSGILTALSAYFMYHFMFKGNVKASFVAYAGTGDYMSYVIIGSVTYLLAVRTCLNVSRSLITELREGTLDSLMIAPFSRIQYFLGNMLQQTITALGEMFITLLVCLPFGVSFSKINLLATLIAFVLSLLSYFAVSMILATVMLYTRDTYISQNTLFSLMFLVCGVTFPVQYLPQWLQWVSKIIPITYSFDIIRNSALRGLGIMEQLQSFGIITITSFIYCFIGFKLLKKVEVIALEKTFG
jgi:ABC-2 type transport system permease protein